MGPHHPHRVRVAAAGRGRGQVAAAAGQVRDFISFYNPFISLYPKTETQNKLLRYENFLVCNYGVGGNKAGQPLYRHPDCGNTGELLYCAWVDIMY